MSNWDAVGFRHGTDKASDGHDYLRCYEGLFDDRSIQCVLEVGVDEGRSLLTWAELWPGAEVWGIELRRDAPLLDMPGCGVLFGDATRPETVAKLPGCAWDLVVDDGSHQYADQEATMALLAPLLSARGVYVVEDVPWDDAVVHPGRDRQRDIDRVLGAMAANYLRPFGVAWSALRQHVAVVAERRP